MELQINVLGALAFGLVALVVLALASVRRVPEGFEYTLERFGRFRRVLRPGLAFVVPFADRIGQRQDLRERSLELGLGEVLTLDQALVAVEATVFYQVHDTARASYEVEDVEGSLRALLTVSVRTLVGDRDLDAVLAGRAALNSALLAAADDAAGVWGVRLVRTEIGRLEPPRSWLEAAAETQLRLQQARAEVSALEETTRARRLRAEGERAAAAAEAEARAEGARIEAEANERLAEGEARAALMLSRALDEGDPRALNYMLARRYVEALTALAESDNGRFVVLPLENGGIAASLTGIRELAEESFATPSRNDTDPSTGAPDPDHIGGDLDDADLGNLDLTVPNVPRPAAEAPSVPDAHADDGAAHDEVYDLDAAADALFAAPHESAVQTDPGTRFAPAAEAPPVKEAESGADGAAERPADSAAEATAGKQAEPEAAAKAPAGPSRSGSMFEAFLGRPPR